MGRGISPRASRFLGANLVAENLLRLNNILSGVMIGQVIPDSPAAKAGLQGVKLLPEGQIGYGDIILKVNDVPIAGNADFLSIIRHHKAGDILHLRVLRDGRERDVQVELGTYDF